MEVKTSNLHFQSPQGILMCSQNWESLLRLKPTLWGRLRCGDPVPQSEWGTWGKRDLVVVLEMTLGVLFLVLPTTHRWSNQDHQPSELSMDQASDILARCPDFIPPTLWPPLQAWGMEVHTKSRSKDREKSLGAQIFFQLIQVQVAASPVTSWLLMLTRHRKRYHSFHLCRASSENLPRLPVNRFLRLLLDVS